MVHYIIPEYLNPTRQGGYMGYCSKHDKIAQCVLIAIITIGALTAIYTLITL